MKNIIHLAKYYLPDHGGIESVTFSLARGAYAAGYVVTVVCFAKHAPVGKEVLSGIKVIRSPVMSVIASQPIGFRYLINCLKSSWKADLIHLHMPNFLAAFCALLMPSKVRLLIHWHSDVINKGILGWLSYPLQFLLLCRADVIVATSTAYANSSFFLSKFNSKVTVIPIGIDGVSKPSKLIRLPDEIEKFAGNEKIILAVGRLVPYKGFEFLILAAKYLIPGVRIIIVGDGPMRSSLESSINNSFLRYRVMLAGRLDDNQLKLLLNRSSIYCMSSINKAEAFGVVMLEAMSSGVPIVATKIPGSGVPWVNEHGVSGLNVPIEDSKSLAQACNQILSSENLRSKFSNGARRRFNNEFTESISISRMLNLYGNLMGSIKSETDSVA